MRVYKLYQSRSQLIYTIKSAVEYLSMCGMWIPGPSHCGGSMNCVCQRCGQQCNLMAAGAVSSALWMLYQLSYSLSLMCFYALQKCLWPLAFSLPAECFSS